MRLIKMFSASLILMLGVAGQANALDTAVTFERVGDADSRIYNILVNGEPIISNVSFANQSLRTVKISLDSLNRFGVPNGQQEAQITQDLENNAFRATSVDENGVYQTEDFFTLTLSEEYVSGMADIDQASLPVERGLFDFQRIRKNRFALSINGIDRFESSTSGYGIFDGGPTEVRISRYAFEKKFGVTDVEHALYREFGDNWSVEDQPTVAGDMFVIPVSFDRASGLGDTVFTFENVSNTQLNDFNVYLNGRMVDASFIDNGGMFIDGDQFNSFTISSMDLATRFGLAGLIDDIFDPDVAMGLFGGNVEVTEQGDGVDKTFTFVVDENFLATDMNKTTVSEQTFFVRRKFASVS